MAPISSKTQSVTQTAAPSPVPIPSGKPSDYYARGGSKVKDFFIGLAFSMGVPFILLMIGVAFNNLFVSTNTAQLGSSMVWGIAAYVLNGLFQVAIVVGIIIAFIKGRRFIAFGLLTPYVLALVAVGSCFALFAMGGGF